MKTVPYSLEHETLILAALVAEPKRIRDVQKKLTVDKFFNAENRIIYWKSGWGKKAPSITVSQLRTLIEVVLPLRQYDIAMTIYMVKWIQQRNHRAYLSHRRRKL